MNRENIIQLILDKHGKNAVYVFTTGYISRTGYKLCKDKYCAFYMQGSMGMAPAIGLGMSLNTDRDIVVINGDGALLMSLGTTHTLRDFAPDNLYHYVLDNNLYESVGCQPCSDLMTSYPGVTEIFKVEKSRVDERISIKTEDISKKVILFLANT
jgi:phosphonopyruvate decarboxylase